MLFHLTLNINLLIEFLVTEWCHLPSTLLYTHACWYMVYSIIISKFSYLIQDLDSRAQQQCWGYEAGCNSPDRWFTKPHCDKNMFGSHFRSWVEFLSDLCIMYLCVDSRNVWSVAVQTKLRLHCIYCVLSLLARLMNKLWKQVAKYSIVQK